MLRVIHQEHGNSQAWDLFLAGNSRKNENFNQYARRIGAEARTPPSSNEAALERQRSIEATRKRLGSLYRAPLKA